jgi:hypothetical protein
VERDAGANEVAYAAPAEIMNDAARQPECGACLRPELSEVADAPTVPMKDIGAIEAARLQTTRNDVGELTAVDGYHSPVAVLAPLGAEAEDAFGSVIVPPLERRLVACGMATEDQIRKAVAVHIKLRGE